MKITFEDEGHQVVWDLHEISVRSRFKALQDFGCHMLDAEIEMIEQETTKLRSKLLEPLKVDGEAFVPDPVRMALVLLMQLHEPADPVPLVTYMNTVLESYKDKK